MSFGGATSLGYALDATGHRRAVSGDIVPA